MARFLETTTPEGDWRSFSFTNPASAPLANGQLYKLEETVGVIFVADKINTNTGYREALEIDGGEVGVLIYHAERIRVPKATTSGSNIGVGQAIYWDGVHGSNVTNVYASGLLWIGICVEDAADDDDTVKIDLHGNHPLAQEAP